MAFISFHPKDYFSVTQYTGNASTNAITGVGLKPDWTWIKGGTYDHCVFDAVRGVTKRLRTNVINGESTVAQGLTAFGTDGFTLGNDGESNASGVVYTSWNWVAGDGQGSSNTDGGINTTYTSVSTTLGVSISTYTGTGSASNIGHGLGVIPKVMLVKRLNASGQWDMYHSGLSDPKSGSIVLNSTDDFALDHSIWNNTDPTSSLVNIGTSSTTNTSGGTYVMYCFTPISGFSAMGSYKGNGQADDGSFVYTGFSPSFVLIKNVDENGDQWQLSDSERGFNGAINTLYPDSGEVETSTDSIDLLSNGFRMKNNSGARNNNNVRYIYLAFAKEPLVSSNGVPATAR